MRAISNTLAAYTSPDLIIHRLSAHGRAAVLGELCSVLAHAGRVSDPLALYEAVMRRERVCSTATEPGWALPHARLPWIERLSFAVGRSETDLEWLDHGAPRVRLVFLFAVPEDEAATYMSLISALGCLSRNSAALEHLLKAENSEAIFHLLRELRLRQTNPATTTS